MSVEYVTLTEFHHRPERLNTRQHDGIAVAVAVTLTHAPYPIRMWCEVWSDGNLLQRSLPQAVHGQGDYTFKFQLPIPVSRLAKKMHTYQFVTSSDGMCFHRVMWREENEDFR